MRKRLWLTTSLLLLITAAVGLFRIGGSALFTPSTVLAAGPSKTCTVTNPAVNSSTVCTITLGVALPAGTVITDQITSPSPALVSCIAGTNVQCLSSNANFLSVGCAPQVPATSCAATDTFGAQVTGQAAGELLETLTYNPPAPATGQLFQNVAASPDVVFGGGAPPPSNATLPNLDCAPNGNLPFPVPTTCNIHTTSAVPNGGTLQIAALLFDFTSHVGNIASLACGNLGGGFNCRLTGQNVLLFTCFPNQGQTVCPAGSTVQAVATPQGTGTLIFAIQETPPNGGQPQQLPPSELPVTWVATPYSGILALPCVSLHPTGSIDNPLGSGTGANITCNQPASNTQSSNNAAQKQQLQQQIAQLQAQQAQDDQALQANRDQQNQQADFRRGVMAQISQRSADRDAAVRQEQADLAQAQADAQQAAATNAQIGDLGTQLQAIQDHLQDLQSQAQAALDQYAAGLISLADANVLISSLNAEIDDASAQFQSLSDQYNALQASEDSLTADAQAQIDAGGRAADQANAAKADIAQLNGDLDQSNQQTATLQTQAQQLQANMNARQQQIGQLQAQLNALA